MISEKALHLNLASSLDADNINQWLKTCNWSAKIQKLKHPTFTCHVWSILHS